MIAIAAPRHPVRIRLAIQPGGLGQSYSEMTAWLYQNCGADEVQRLNARCVHRCL
jgi:hypothetical protein